MQAIKLGERRVDQLLQHWVVSLYARQRLAAARLRAERQPPTAPHTAWLERQQGKGAPIAKILAL